MLSLWIPPVKVDVKLGSFVLAAHQDWPPQLLHEIYVQAQGPVNEALPHQLIQNQNRLVVERKNLLVAA